MWEVFTKKNCLWNSTGEGTAIRQGKKKRGWAQLPSYKILKVDESSCPEGKEGSTGRGWKEERRAERCFRHHACSPGSRGQYCDMRGGDPVEKVNSWEEPEARAWKGGGEW